MARNPKPPKKPGPITRAAIRIVLGPEEGRVSGTQQVDEELQKLIADQSKKDKEDPK